MISEASEKKGGPYTKNEKEQRQNEKFQKNGGPYSKFERHKRRQEVIRLHFEKGYSAIKIAEILQINRHTISNYIQIGYNQLKKDWTKYDSESIGIRQFQRYENHRFGLVEQVESLDNPKDILAYKKLIFEIDKEITNHFLKITNTQDLLYYHITKQMNMLSEKNNLGMGFVCMQDMFRVSPETAEKVNKLLDDDISKLKLRT